VAGYRVCLISERAIAPALRRELAELLSGILDDGPLYAGEAWRTIPPAFRAVVSRDGRVVGQASGFAVETEPDVDLVGLGDVAVDPQHRRRGLARALCRLVTDEARRRGAAVALAKTKPLRTVLGDLGYRPVTTFAYYHEQHGACLRHPDWMAVAWRAHPTPVRLREGDF
jgi:predicted N-acetyltransferase YhbS